VLNLWDAYIRAAQVGWDANVVVAMRLMRLGLGGECRRVADGREADARLRTNVTRLSPQSRCAALLDHLFGAGERIRRHFEAEHPCGLVN